MIAEEPAHRAALSSFSHCPHSLSLTRTHTSPFSSVFKYQSISLSLYSSLPFFFFFFFTPFPFSSPSLYVLSWIYTSRISNENSYKNSQKIWMSFLPPSMSSLVPLLVFTSSLLTSLYFPFLLTFASLFWSSLTWPYFQSWPYTVQFFSFGQRDPLIHTPRSPSHSSFSYLFLSLSNSNKLYWQNHIHFGIASAIEELFELDGWGVLGNS